MADGISRISTHVLDTTLGKPAARVPVRLEQQDNDGGWITLSSSSTNADGRCDQMLSESVSVKEGRYRLIFETATYYAAQKVSGLYPVVEITFEVRKGDSRCHIPLLLSPNSYTTYRGS